MAADSRLPAKIDHGCAKGVAEVTNNRTAEAPIGAAKLKAIWLPNRIWLQSINDSTPRKAPLAARSHCFGGIFNDRGVKALIL
jgi:hypothetical protein